MTQEKNQIKQELNKAIKLKKELDDLQSDCVYDVYDSNVDWNKPVSLDDIASLVDEKMEPTKPQEKEIKPLQKVSLKIKDIITYAIVLAIGLVGIIVPLCYISVMGVGVVEFMLVGVAFFLVGIISLTKQLVALHKNKIVNDKIKLENKEIEKFNAEEYPKQLQEFEITKEQYAKKYIKQVNDAHKKVYELRGKVEELDILSFKYLHFAQEILDYIVDKRADTIKEAVNLLVEEQREKVQDEKQQTIMLKQNISEAPPVPKSKWARLSKLAHAMIILPIFTLPAPIIWFVVTSIQNKQFAILNPELHYKIIGSISLCLICGTFVFLMVGMFILIYRKLFRDLAKAIRNGIYH